MTVHALNLACPSATQAETIADALQSVADAVSWFEQEDGAVVWMVSAYFDGMPDDALLRETIAGAGNAALAAQASIEALPEQDWVAESQRHLPPVRAGGFVIHGSHDRNTVLQDVNAIEIDAGAAFGTAHHGTTTGCLDAITRLSIRPEASSYGNILDLGTGSAILAIAASRRWPSARILATDIDPVAIIVAERNAELNKAAQITFAVADGFDSEDIAARQHFDLVLANILAGPLIDLAKNICGVVTRATHGRIILSGLLDEQADDVTTAYQACGFTVEERSSREGWSTLILHRGGA